MSTPLPGEGDPLGAYEPQTLSLPQSSADALAQTAITTAEKKATERIVVLTLAAILGVKAIDWSLQTKKWENDGRFNDPYFQSVVSAEFARRLRKPLVPILSGMFLLGRHTLGQSIGLELVSHAATKVIADTWARHYINKVTSDFAVTSAEALRPSIADWLTRPLPAAAMAQRARDLYGLDPRAAAAVQSYAAKPGRGKDAHSLIDRYLEHRAKSNATVWTMAAHNGGRELLYNELVDSGHLPVDVRKVWVTAHDERVCPVCGPMDGVSVSLNGRFHVAGALLVAPPVHPNCRCTITTDVQPVHGALHAARRHSVEHFLATAAKSIFR